MNSTKMLTFSYIMHDAPHCIVGNTARQDSFAIIVQMSTDLQNQYPSAAVWHVCKCNLLQLHTHLRRKNLRQSHRRSSQYQPGRTFVWEDPGEFDNIHSRRAGRVGCHLTLSWRFSLRAVLISSLRRRTSSVAIFMSLGSGCRTPGQVRSGQDSCQVTPAVTAEASFTKINSPGAIFFCQKTDSGFHHRTWRKQPIEENKLTNLPTVSFTKRNAEYMTRHAVT